MLISLRVALNIVFKKEERREIEMVREILAERNKYAVKDKVVPVLN
jgi:hypothetical protein